MLLLVDTVTVRSLVTRVPVGVGVMLKITSSFTASVLIPMTLSTEAPTPTPSLSAELVPTLKNAEPEIKARRKQAIKTAVRAKTLFATTRPLLAAVDCRDKPGNDDEEALGREG